MDRKISSCTRPSPPPRSPCLGCSCTFFQVDQNKIILNSKTLNDSSIVGAAELITKGWDSEAIPYSEEKKSILAGIFSRFFNN